MSDELHTLSGAYAVHALPDRDGVLFEKHMAGCASCLAEVRRLRETAVLLALSVAEPPPVALRARVLAAVDRTRQAPIDRIRPMSTDQAWPSSTDQAWPTSTDQAWPSSADDAPTVWRPRRPAEDPAVWEASDPADNPSSWDATLRDLRRPPGDATVRAAGLSPGDATVWEAGLSPDDVTVWKAGPSLDDATVREAVPASDSGRPSEQAATIRILPEIPATPEISARPEGGVVVPLRRWRGRAVAGLAAVSTAAAIALGVVVFDVRRDLGDLQARDGEVAAVLAAPDVRTVRLPVTAGGSGTVVVSRAQGRVLFTSSGLPELPRSRVYELWLMGRDGIRPAGLLDQRPDGVTTPMLASASKGDEHIGLTVEPAGGSKQPTTQPVLFAELPTA